MIVSITEGCSKLDDQPFLPPPRRLCFHLCLCFFSLSVCLVTGLLKILSLLHFMEWLDVIHGPIDCILSDLDLHYSSNG